VDSHGERKVDNRVSKETGDRQGWVFKKPPLKRMCSLRNSKRDSNFLENGRRVNVKMPTETKRGASSKRGGTLSRGGRFGRGNPATRGVIGALRSAKKRGL